MDAKTIQARFIFAVSLSTRMLPSGEKRKCEKMIAVNADPTTLTATP